MENLKILGNAQAIHAELSKGQILHQRKFYFIDHSPDRYTDLVVEAMLHYMCKNPDEVKVTGITRIDGVLSIHFDKKLCLRVGFHSPRDDIKLELRRRKDIDLYLQVQRQSKWQHLK